MGRVTDVLDLMREVMQTSEDLSQLKQLRAIYLKIVELAQEDHRLNRQVEALTAELRVRRKSDPTCAGPDHQDMNPGTDHGEMDR